MWFSQMFEKTALFSVLFQELERTSTQIVESNELLISGNLCKEEIKFLENSLYVLRNKKEALNSIFANYLRGGL